MKWRSARSAITADREKFQACKGMAVIWPDAVAIILPLIFMLPHLMSDAVMGVYLAEPIADTIAVCTTAPMFYFYYRKLEQICKSVSKRMYGNEKYTFAYFYAIVVVEKSGLQEEIWHQARNT